MLKRSNNKYSKFSGKLIILLSLHDNVFTPLKI